MPFVDIRQGETDLDELREKSREKKRKFTVLLFCLRSTNVSTPYIQVVTCKVVRISSQCAVRSARLLAYGCGKDSRDDGGVRAIEIQGPAARTSHWTGTADDMGMVWYEFWKPR